MRNISLCLSDVAARYPQLAAFQVPRRVGSSLFYDTLTFDALELRVCRSVTFLQAQGVKFGERIWIAVKNPVDFVTLIFAALRVGAIPIVVDAGMSLKTLRQCLIRSRPDYIFGGFAACMLAKFFLKNTVKNIWICSDFVEKLGYYAPAPANFDEWPNIATAAILFTSGSTGAPKGVVYTHGHFHAQIEILKNTYGLSPRSVDFPLLRVFALFNPLLGVTTVIPEINVRRPAQFLPEYAVQAILQQNVTQSFGAPSLWQKIAQYAEEHATVLPSLKLILIAGAAVAPALVARLKKIAPNALIHTPYGATEALPITTIHDDNLLARHGAKGGVCVGKPLGDAEVKIIAASEEVFSKMPCSLEEGEIGEVVVCGSMVTREYDQMPEATYGAKIDDDGICWHRMGDVGYLDADGYLWIVGRKAERVVTVNGMLDTVPCEAIFNRHPQVAKCALIGVGACAPFEPVVVVEPVSKAYPLTAVARERFINDLRALGQQSVLTASIGRFEFERKLPVDVRHNAKIYRLTLARKYSKLYKNI